jgi:N6-adenosine-specific RNA methylase IME4
MDDKQSQFDVILADPPWTFRTWSDKGAKRGPKYPVMTLEDICNLPVAEVTAENCALFLWVTWPLIENQAFDVIASWGFTYRTLAWEWIKLDKSGKPSMGLGYYTRSNAEPCLLCVKGSMPVADHSISNILMAQRRKHSQKPDEQYERIERLYPNMRYLELFARNRRPGWAAWGNEIESDPIWRQDESKVFSVAKQRYSGFGDGKYFCPGKSDAGPGGEGIL